MINQKISISGFVVLFVILFVCPLKGLRAQKAVSQKGGAVLYAEDFNSYKDGELPSGWWAEGGQAVYVKEGHLVIKADPQKKKGPGYVATVWCKRQFSGNIKVQFDAQVISSTIGVNNINFFLYFSYPDSTLTMYETRNFRLDGLYSHYHNLNGYIFTYLKPPKVKTDKARFRMRRVPGFELIDENFAYQNIKGKTYHIAITKKGIRLSFYVDGKKYLQAKDNKYNWTKGLIGFRTYQSVIWIDNLKVTRLKKMSAASSKS